MAFDEDRYCKDQAAFDALRNSRFYSSRMKAKDFAILQAFIERSHVSSRASKLSIKDEEAREAEILLHLGYRLASDAEYRLQTYLMGMGSAVATGLFFLVLLAISPTERSLSFALGCLGCSAMLGLFLFAALRLGGYESLKATVLTLIQSRSISGSAS